MAQDVPAVRILPMSTKEFEGRTAEEVQCWFLTELPAQESGRYFYRSSGMDTESDTLVLFQYDGRLIACAILEECERFEQMVDGHSGAFKFKTESIKVFDPVDAVTLREVWPEFRRFSHAKTKLNPNLLSEFERRLTNVRTSARSGLHVHDLESPRPDRIMATISRIVRDTECSWRVKSLHANRCQIAGCEHPVQLADGSLYAEAHHVRPLGRPHDGPDVPGNILCLCPNHHAACDLGAIQLSANNLRQIAGHPIDETYLEYHNSVIYRG